MDALKSLINLSQSVATAPSLTQGGGGNTSVKNGREMLIKASGFRLDEVSDSKGFVKVNYAPIQSFLDKKTAELVHPDAELKQLANDVIIGDKTYLPSMETGFHAVLNQYVIHTHPVVANQLLCSSDCENKLKAIFKDEPFILLPSLNPGYYLSKAIADIKNTSSIIFLTNHGLIVHGDNEEETIALHAKVIQKLDAALNHTNNFLFELVPLSEKLYELKTEFINVYFSHPNLLSSTYFPDQAVVIGQDFMYSENYAIAKKLNFIQSTSQCFIKTSHKNALAIAENLAALANIFQYNYLNQSPLISLREEDVAYILGMDMEKYRQGLLH